MTRWINRLVVAAGLVVGTGSSMHAQTTPRTATLSSATCPGTGCLVVGVSGSGGLGIKITGSFSGTITFKSTVQRYSATPDCSVTTDFTSLGVVPIATPAGTPVTSTTAVGNWSAAVGGQTHVCIVFTSYSSGSAVVTTNTAPTTGRSGGGSGGGGGSGDALTTDPLSQFASTTSDQLRGVISNPTGTGALAFATSPTFVTPILGTPTSGTLTNTTGFPTANLAGLGTGVATFLATPSSVNLLAAMTTKTGTGSVVFGTSPTLTTPVLGVAAGTSIALTTLAGSGTRCVQTDNNGLVAVAAAGCGSTGATAALDNLSAVNINSALLAQSSVDLGSTTKPFKDVYFYGSGTYGTNYIRLTGAPTGARVVTLPNLTSTLMYLGGPGGTPSSIDLTNATSTTLPIAAIGGLSTGIATFLATATVANLATALGSQSANTVFASPDGSAGNGAMRSLTYGYLPQAVPITELSAGATLSSYNGTYELNFASPDTIVLPATASHPGAGASFSAVNGSSNYTLDGNSSETICDNSGCATTKTYSANQSVTLEVNAAGTGWRVVAGEKSGGASSTVYPKAPGLRLTTQSGVCKSTADRTAQGTLYYTPGGDCGGGSYAVAYSGSAWVEFTQAELTLSLTLTSGKNYDVYYCYNSGTPNLSLSAAWTNDTTRADAQAKQDGFVVKSSDHTCLNVGTIRASGSNVTEDSAANAYVWNRFVKMPHDLKVIEGTDSWSYTTATWRQANATATNQISYVTGDAATTIAGTVVAGWIGASGAEVSVAIGVDSTSSPTGSIRGSAYSPDSSNGYTIVARYNGAPGLGKHSLMWLEYGAVTGGSTFLGDDGSTIVQSGIDGVLLD